MRYPALAFLFLGTVAYANDGSGAIALGGTVRPAKTPHPSIRLMDETIRVKLPEGRVRVEFTFRNEGAATSVTMVFPENGYRASEMPGFKKGRTSQFGYFRTWVDGKPTTATLRRIDSPGGDDEGYENWWTKSVSFKAGQTRKVVNEYQGGLLFGPPWTPERAFTYILETGKSWKGGRIGITVAVFDAREVYAKSPVELAPKGWTGWKGYYVWERRDFVPQENLSISWYDGYLRFFVNAVPAEKLLQLEQATDAKVMPVRKGDEIYIPVRMAAKALGATFADNPNRLETHLKKVEISEVPGVYIDRGRTMVPLRFVTNKLGGRYAWYSDGLRIVMPPKPEGAAN